MVDLRGIRTYFYLSLVNTLWVKKDCLNCKYYSKFCEFKTAIDNSLNKIFTGQAQSELESLLTLKFQLFK